jgi:hypothetical protein
MVVRNERQGDSEPGVHELQLELERHFGEHTAGQKHL